MKSGFLDKLIDRLDRIDPGSLQTHFLRLSQEKGLLETIFNAIQEGVLVLDGEGRITYANKTAQGLLGLDPENAEGEPIRKYLRDVDWEGMLEFDEEEWSRLTRRELEITYPEQRFVEFYVVPLAAVSEGEEELPQGAVVILRDVTREREQQASNMESERLQAITLLAASVAHEIGNPLNSLTIHLQLLEREMKNLPEEDASNLGELVTIAKDEIQRLDQIITQFLGAVRPSKPQLEPQQVEELIEESLAVIKQEADDRGVWIEVESAEHIPTAMIDKGQIRQAIFNIVKNSIQAMQSGGLLKINVGFNDKFVTVAFEDTGSGIAPEDLSHIFEAYHTTKSGGTGLGLMIVQRIIRDHGGLMEIDSRPKQGTTFTLHLPRKDERIRLLTGPETEPSDKQQELEL